MRESKTGVEGQEAQTLRRELDRLQGRFSLLSKLGTRITATLDPTAVLQAVVDGACELTGARYGALGVFDSSGRIQQFITRGVTEGERERIGDLPAGRGILGWLHEVQAPVRLPDLAEHPRSSGFPPHHPPMKTFLGAPLRHGEDALGNLYLTEKGNGEEFTPEDESLLLLFAAQATLAIRNAEAHEQVQAHLHEVQRLVHEVDALHAVTKIATSTLDLEELLAKALPVLLERTRADAAEVWVHNASTGMLELRAHDGEAAEVFFSQTTFAPGEGIVGQVFEQREPIISTDLVQDRRIVRRRIVEAGFNAFRAFPVLFRGTSVGVLCVACRDPHKLTEQDDLLLARAADELAPALVNAELFAQVEQLASARAQALRLAEQERSRMEALVQSSPVGVFVADTEGNVLLVNNEARRILGPSFALDNRLQEYEERITYVRSDGQEYAAEDLPLQRALYRGESVRAEEMRFRFPDGHAVPTLINATPIYSSEGTITGAIATIQDITPLEEVERLRNEFLGMVSHELKTPLTAIKGSAATALGSRRPFSPAEIHELFEIVDEQADRLRDLVDNLLDMSRIEVGSLSVHTEPADLGSIVDEVLTTFRRSNGEVEVRVDGLAAQSMRVQADRRRVSQVLWNLLSNAAKFSPPGAPITLQVEPRETDVVIRVEDKGRGIPSEKIPHLFKKFSQVHDDPKVRMAGSGLGLAISKGIVEAHGGRIWAESEGDGHGATFAFTLPRVVEETVAGDSDQGAQEASLVAHRTAHMGRVGRAGERTRILAVDDDLQTLRYVRRTLEDAGYALTVTSDPQDVIGLVEAEEPDLVLLDLLLPGTSGLELLERIREFSGVPVIFLTAQGDSEDTVRALRMGADDYIGKPFSPSELVARIEAALRRRVFPDQAEVRPPFRLDDLTIDFAQRRVTVSGEEARLTATEYKLLYELATHAGQVLTHDQILQRVWGHEYLGETDLVRSFVRNLRRKLGDDARQPRYIYTEPQVGYRIPHSTAES